VGDTIHYEVSDGIGTITIDRPEKRNAMTYAILEEFLEVVGRAGRDDAARVLILTGSGGAFCAGTDLADLKTVPGERREGRGRADQGARWWPIVECPKPVIAAVDGAAVGMGAEFTLQCDVRIASTRARFAWNFVHRGLVPDTGAGSWLLPRVVGVPVAARLLFSGEFLSASEALEIGYVSQVVEPENLAAAARAEAQRFSSGSPLSMKLIKELLYRGLAGDVEDHMTRHLDALKTCFRSEDHKEGVAAFLERREAKFLGR
jgi:enoyl-CoA hydratase/carnithine racemase